jgi:hypothetical protein
MKYFVPLLTLFAILTQPDGYPVQVAKAQVVAVLRAVNGDCPAISPRADKDDTHTIITFSNGARLCVAEPPATAAAEIEKP